MLNLDTHILISLLVDDLSDKERDCVLRQKLAISDIVLWEIAKLIDLGRIHLNIEAEEFRLAVRYLIVIPINIEIARASTELDFTSDPADEIIAATSIVEKIPLLTRDRRILKSKMVPFAL